MDPQRRASSVGVALADGLCTPSQYAPMRNTVRHRAFRRVAAELADADACAVDRGALSPTNLRWARTLGVLLVPLTEDLTRLRGFLRGPPDTPFADATFAVDIVIGAGYPFEPPKAHFCTGNTQASALMPRPAMESVPWHPNVSSQTGYICCTILKEGGWGPAHTLKLLLQGLQTLLQCPEWDDPVNDEVRRMWSQSPAEYEKTARLWSKERALDVSLFERMLESVPEKIVVVPKKEESLPEPHSVSGGEGAAYLSLPAGSTTGSEAGGGSGSSMNEGRDSSGVLLGSFKMSTKSQKGAARDWCGATEGGCSIS